jgi:CPA1 family monovalent cation:H+ antiporter
MLANSLIGKEVYSNLLGEMTARYQNLQESLSLDLGLDAEKLVAKVPFFQSLDAGAQQNIAAMLKPRLVLPGEAVFELGGPPDAMYFISSGAVRVPLRDGEVILGSGDFFGELALLWDNPRMASVYAEGFCELLTLYTRDFDRLLAEDAQVKAVIEQVASERREIAKRDL